MTHLHLFPFALRYLPKHFARWVLPTGCPHRQGVTQGTRRWAALLIFQLGPAEWQQAVVLQLLMAGFGRLQPQAVQGPAQCPSSLWSALKHRHLQLPCAKPTISVLLVSLNRSILPMQPVRLEASAELLCPVCCNTCSPEPA